MPNFPGGETALMKYISEHLVYPQEAKDAGVEGRVFVGVVVMEDGNLACAKVLKGLGYGCDEAALEVFEGMPNWMPAMQRGKAICYPYEVPVFFGHKQDGSVSSIKLLRGIGYGCDEAAMDVVRKMPKWKPATQRGKPVRVQYQLPFNFKLENEKQK